MNSFLKNLWGAERETGAATDTTTGTNRNENLSGRDFKKQFESTPGAVLLDVRTAGEFSMGTIPGAKNIDFLSPAFAQKAPQLDKSVTYFVFCRSGNRSASACRQMHRLGFDVRNLAYGIGDFPF